MTSIQGLEDLQRKFKTLENFQRKMKPPVDKSMKLLQKEWATKPRKKKGAFSALATQKQKRAYWARVSSGEAEHRKGVGYKRTNAIVNAITDSIDISVHSNGVTGKIGTNAPGAKYVIGPQKDQQLFHFASGWKYQEQVIDAKSDEIQKIFKAVVKRELNK